ncbi:methyltransferase domain-containing protein [Pseudonocardiaceae bacterium YIM PH 21723]|nr:methyltransferase domain-containing protein [Pseudonocardiaceae bacterium YIM PH 21723]
MTDSGGYGAGLLEHSIPLEQRRLRALQDFADPITRQVLLERGLRPGRRCLEIGAGAGSIARFLAEHSAPCETVATDLDVSLLPADPPNLTALSHDVTRDEFPDNSFDLIHSRAVLEHLPNPADTIGKLVRWAAPGGWVCADGVVLHGACAPGTPFDRCMRAVMVLLVDTMRVNLDLPLRLPRMFTAAGLRDVGVRLTAGFSGRGGNADEVLRLSLQQVAPAMVEQGLLDQRDLDAGLAQLDGDFTDLSLTMVSVWGRKPR